MARQPTATAKQPRKSTRKPATRKPRQQRPPKLDEAEKQELARAKELEELYRPLRDAAEAELQKTKSGRKLLEDIQGLAREFGEPGKGMTVRETPSEEAGLRLRERLDEFRRRSGDEFVEAHARHVHLQPSAQAVAQILCPAMATQTVWVSETSPTGSMLLQPKPIPANASAVGGPEAIPADAGTVTEGLGGSPPPLVHSCVTPPFTRKDEHMTSAVIWSPYRPLSQMRFRTRERQKLAGIATPRFSFKSTGTSHLPSSARTFPSHRDLPRTKQRSATTGAAAGRGPSVWGSRS
jgi:transposase